MTRVCRIHSAPIVHTDRNYAHAITDNHPLALVRYRCGHHEIVRHEDLDR